jgi:DNA-binding CsgD family transcriptional regulator/catechol 2,3-dioxygenase-like lactoylglutathione lyase family enzyme
MPRGRPAHDDALTPAEWRVVEFIRHGLTNAGIAAHLGISLYAVRAHQRAAVGKLGLADRQALKHWDGARKGTLRSEGAVTQMGPISQIARRVENLDRARAFFKDIVGLSELYAFPGLAFFDLGPTRLMLTEKAARCEADILYFKVPAIGAAHQALTARGASFTGAPHMIHRHPDGTEEWMAFFKDDEGRDLALHAVHAPVIDPRS